MAEYPVAHKNKSEWDMMLDKYRATNAMNPPKSAKINGFEEDINDIAFDLVQLLIKKHKDYGPLNISNSPGGAVNGLRVRMHDKMARINHLVDTGAKPTNESLEDSFADLANYAIIGLMVLKGKWPNA